MWRKGTIKFIKQHLKGIFCWVSARCFLVALATPFIRLPAKVERKVRREARGGFILIPTEGDWGTRVRATRRTQSALKGRRKAAWTNTVASLEIRRVAHSDSELGERRGHSYLLESCGLINRPPRSVTILSFFYPYALLLFSAKKTLVGFLTRLDNCLAWSLIAQE